MDDGMDDGWMTAARARRGRDRGSARTRQGSARTRWCRHDVVCLGRGRGARDGGGGDERRGDDGERDDLVSERRGSGARARRAVERDVVEDEWNDRVDGRVGGEDARGARWWR